MASYRLYFLDASGHIQSARELEAASDEAALESCQRLIHGQRGELWNRSRLVKRIGPMPRQRPDLNL